MGVAARSRANADEQAGQSLTLYDSYSLVTPVEMSIAWKKQSEYSCLRTCAQNKRTLRWPTIKAVLSLQ